MTTSKAYSIVEFHDGLAIVSSLWLNKHETKCAYPTFRDPAKIMKAVESKLPSEDNSNWKIYDVVIFYRTSKIYYSKFQLLCSLFVNMSICHYNVCVYF